MNAAVFHNDIENLQVTLDAGSCSSRVSFNVEEAHAGGLELEFSNQLTDNLFVAFAGTYVRSEFDSTVVDGTNTVLAGIREGNRLASTPELTMSFSAVYTYDASWAGSGAEAPRAPRAPRGSKRVQELQELQEAPNCWKPCLEI